MKQTLLAVSLLMAVGFAGCNDKNTATQTTTTTVATTTSTAATTTSTTSVPAPQQFTLSGRVIDQGTGRAIPLVDFEIIEGANVGRTFRSDANGAYTVGGLNPGSFTMRVRTFGYPSTDVRVTITNANVTVDIALLPLPTTTTTTSSPTTTTTVPALLANFTWSPDPCVISGGATPFANCTVDASSSTGNNLTIEWKYKGKTVTGQTVHSLQIACSDLGSVRDDTIFVTLTITDDGGGTSSVTKGITIIKSGACGF